MSTDGETRINTQRRNSTKKTWKNKSDDNMNNNNKPYFDNSMKKRQFNNNHKKFNKNTYNSSNNNNQNNNNNNNQNNGNSMNNSNENNNSFSTNMVQLPSHNNNNREYNHRGRSFVSRNRSRQYRSARGNNNNEDDNNQHNDQNNNNLQSNKNQNNNNNHRHNKNNGNRFNRNNRNNHSFTNNNSKTRNHHNNHSHHKHKQQQQQQRPHSVIPRGELEKLVAGDHVEITTKHKQIIDGYVYCNIPQMPPLCIIHHYNPERTKNVYVVALDEIEECIKFDEPKQERHVELRPINEESSNEILEKNLAERKAKMETLNINVNDVTQDLFDFLYRTLPNKCEWNENKITFNDQRIILKEPYKSITFNGSTKKNKSIQYIETQLKNFWRKQAEKLAQQQMAMTSPRGSESSTPSKKKKKKKK